METLDNALKQTLSDMNEAISYLESDVHSLQKKQRTVMIVVGGITLVVAIEAFGLFQMMKGITAIGQNMQALGNAFQGTIMPAAQQAPPQQQQAPARHMAKDNEPVEVIPEEQKTVHMKLAPRVPNTNGGINSPVADPIETPGNEPPAWVKEALMNDVVSPADLLNEEG